MGTLKMRYKNNLVLFTLFAINLVDQPAPQVVIEQGTLTGKISGDGTYFEYLGIPYGVFTSETRFKAPSPPPKWDGVYKAVDEMYSCPQPSFFGTVVGSEDCLRVNVYVPATAKAPLPVMVYIHGGAFKYGSGGKLLYAPDFLIKNDIIMVTMNYRLNALGFICLGIEDAPGNAGLKDQLAALRWVKKNIAAFGGDPDNITLFGESAGSASTSILLASDEANGLYNRAIMQSGNSLGNWVINRRPVWTASLLAKALGYDTEDPYEIYEILSKLSYKELIKLYPDKPIGKFFDTKLLYLPCIEKSIPNNKPILNDIPYNLIKKKENHVPILIGSTSREGYLLINLENEDTLRERNQRYLFASDLEFDSEEEANRTAAEIKHFYFGNENISRNNINTLTKLYTELYFGIPSALETETILSSSKTTVYNFLFDYNGNRNLLKYALGYGNEEGACHADDLPYLFSLRVWPFRINQKDAEVIRQLTRLWTNFAKYGNPTPSVDDQLSFTWTPSSANDFKYLYIDDNFTMGSMPNPESYELWRTIYEKYRRTNLGYYFE